MSSIWNLITLQAILDATVLQRDRFCAVVEAQDNLRIVEMPSWAGLGVVQYVCKNVMLKITDQVYKSLCLVVHILVD